MKMRDLKAQLTRISATLTGALFLFVTGPAALASERVIIKGISATPVAYETFIADLALADIVLLGEIHENPLHHEVRARLIEALAHPRLTAVAEHLHYRQQVDFSGDLLADLQRAGFDPKAWEWPMHQLLFESVRRTGLRLVGGNLTSEQSSRLSRQGESVLPVEVARLIGQAPLDESAIRSLDEALFEGHCRMIPNSVIPKMRVVQRGRDAAMAQVAMDNMPAVMLVGNGHAWKQVGIPQVIASVAPRLKVVSVIFSEGMPQGLERADYFWITPEVQRPDPCERLRPKTN